ncbi:energy-coupling factor ABC transporter ATP-binding protein [Paenibacillus sp. J2TS4]|uniref:energy-coupling factor ABC transporter ATP-binding protein n=1 Tax=Paenibacillus sp. J2TS4 TaxID=2807194 RepID=UPI001B03FCD6|nr:ABC transporter ATP-binding protein [Paenibacillus sp. J2TS4]GIP31216.1 energy-coupling factor ABC transporter ATP-binding protein [Paenibacillus sp. J2TS4]
MPKQQPVIQLGNVSWRYEERDKPALKRIQLELRPGEVVGVTGPSGAGKTTLLLALTGLIPSNYEGEFTGTRAVSGEIGIVFQDPETQFVGLTVEEEIAFPLENRGFRDEEIGRILPQVLERVGLPGFAERSPFELSGGEKQRVAIASMLAVSPQIVVLDEPTSELDPIGAREVFSLLHRLKQEQEVTIIVASHATEELAAFCDRMILIDDGEIELDAPTSEFFTHLDLLDAAGIYVPDLIRFHHWLTLEENQPSLPPLTVEEMIRRYSSIGLDPEMEAGS